MLALANSDRLAGMVGRKGFDVTLRQRFERRILKPLQRYPRTPRVPLPN